MPNALTLMTTAVSNDKPAASSKPEPKTKSDRAFEDLVAESEAFENTAPLGQSGEALSQENDTDEPSGQDEDESSVLQPDPLLTWVAKQKNPSDEMESPKGTRELTPTGQPLGENGKSRAPVSHPTTAAQIQLTQKLLPQPVETTESADPMAPNSTVQNGAGIAADVSRQPAPAPATPTVAKQAGDTVVPLVPQARSDDRDGRLTARIGAGTDSQQPDAHQSVSLSGNSPGQSASALTKAKFAEIAGTVSMAESVSEDDEGDPLASHEPGSIQTERANPRSQALLAPSTRAEVARGIAGQLAAVVTAKPGGGSVEIALNPEELGKVSIILKGREDGMHLMIVADRPETLDLMRRHITILSAEFRDIGFEDLSFDMGMSSDTQQDRETPEHGTFLTMAETETEMPDLRRRMNPDRALDLRL